MSVDYYKVLMVTRTASQEEIQKAYHALAVKHHPDANPGDNEAAARFKEINKAYQVLRSPDKRKEYDSSLSGSHGRASRPPQPTSTRGRAGAANTVRDAGSSLDDMLGEMRGAVRGNARTDEADQSAGEQKGAPTVEIKLTAREALSGATRTILVNGRPLRIKIVITR